VLHEEKPAWPLIRSCRPFVTSNLCTIDKMKCQESFILLPAIDFWLQFPSVINNGLSTPPAKPFSKMFVSHCSGFDQIAKICYLDFVSHKLISARQQSTAHQINEKIECPCSLHDADSANYPSSLTYTRSCSSLPYQNRTLIVFASPDRSAPLPAILSR